jgi:hypothetical protein
VLRARFSFIHSFLLTLCSALSQANSLLAGCITGAVLAVHTRKAPVVALSAAISGALMLGVDGAGALYNSVVAAQQQRN